MPPQITLIPQRLADTDLADLLDLFRAGDGAHHDGPTCAPGGEHPIAARPPDDGPRQQIDDAEHAEDRIEPRADSGAEDTSPGPGRPGPMHPHEATLTPPPDNAGRDPAPSDPTQAPEAQPPFEPGTQPPRAGRGILTPRLVLTTDRPCLRLLGPVRVDNAPGKHPEAPGTALKILTHLALHPGVSRHAG